MESLKRVGERGVVIARRHGHTNESCVLHLTHVNGQTKTSGRQPLMWMMTADLPTVASHPFYWRLNQLLGEHGSDDFAEAQCATFYAETMLRMAFSNSTVLRWVPRRI